MERLYRRRVPDREDVTPELLRHLTELSLEIRRRVAVLLDRRGRVKYVCVGDLNRVILPEQVREMRVGRERLCGLRVVHTRLRGEGFSKPDLTDLLRFRLDLSTQVQVSDEGLPHSPFRAHLLPPNREEKVHEILGPSSPYEEKFAFRDVVEALEEEFSSSTPLTQEARDKKTERAILVAVTTGAIREAQASMTELVELARTSGAVVMDEVVQRRDKIDGRTIVGKGMLEELALRQVRTNADLFVFDRQLTPAQARNIERELTVKVIDRTQLILDIFAQRAVTAEGKLQVELARLKYMIPHLTYGRESLAQIRGGIGSNRGLGEKKSELDRRYVRERVKKLEGRIDDLASNRSVMRKRRLASNVATVAIVGYTNAGKSTLFNVLTGATVLAEDRLFATLGTTARRLLPTWERPFDEDHEHSPDIASGPERDQSGQSWFEEGNLPTVVLTDTVGFIHDLPRDLAAAFRATLEELGDVDLLMHVADASSEQVHRQVRSVRKILEDMGFGGIPRIIVYNKRDAVDEDEFGPFARREDGLLVSAFRAEDMEELKGVIRTEVGRGRKSGPSSPDQASQHP